MLITKLRQRQQPMRLRHHPQPQHPDRPLLAVSSLDYKSSLQSNQFKRELFSARGLPCGYFTWTLYRTPNDLGERFSPYLQRISNYPKCWPLAVFEDLFVQKKFRKRGRGRVGVRLFIQNAQEQGAVCGLLKVGWNSPPEDPETARRWKTIFYASEGFIELPWFDYEPVLMCRDLEDA